MCRSVNFKVAENVADELARSDGREVKLEEDVELQLPFLLPEDGYSCDVVRGVPQGLTEFLQPLQSAGLCRMNVQPTSSGQWTIYMTEPMTNVIKKILHFFRSFIYLRAILKFFLLSMDCTVEKSECYEQQIASDSTTVGNSNDSFAQIKQRNGPQHRGCQG